MKLTAKLWLGIALLIILSPFGLLLSEHFNAGSAWGEWGADEMREMVGYVPEGLQKLSSVWNAPMPDYAFKGWEEKGLTRLSIAYIISALLGICLIVLIMLLLGKLLSNKEKGKEK